MYYAMNVRTPFTAHGTLDEIIEAVKVDCIALCGIEPVIEPNWGYGDVFELHLSSEDPAWVAVVFSHFPEISGYRFYEDI